ncbi:MAG: polyprenyl diphosphate synthase [Myxococcota bacterium]
MSRLPRHVAITMDGNGRWALQLGKPRSLGHRAGSDAVRTTVRACRRLGVSALTLYAFSAQNWSRPQLEVDALMGLLREFLVKERAEILDHHIRLIAVGAVDRLPPSVREVLDPLVEESKDHQGMTLSLALSYGGQEEITRAAQAVVRRVLAGELTVDEIEPGHLEAEMHSMDVGPVDLLIRTGGEQRISNFLLWGAAYAELYFSEKLWPDYQESDIYEAIAAYQKRDRRFGRAKSTDLLAELPLGLRSIQEFLPTATPKSGS